METIFKVIQTIAIVIAAAYIVGGITLFVIAIYAGMEDEKNENT